MERCKRPLLTLSRSLSNRSKAEIYIDCIVCSTPHVNMNMNMGIDTSTAMPSISREFPGDRTTMLPPKFAMICYMSSGGRTITRA